MPRAEVGTPKWLANKMKAKGLQKLKWFCQMCQKQCRDENGFKCHRLSEAHQRQMKVFAQSPNKFMDEFSREFEHSFMRLMSTTYCRQRVLANTVYCDLIADKMHIHMNSTIWVTLSEFVQYLERSGKIKAERTERGWWVEYIDQDKLRREKEFGKSKLAELTEEQRHQRRLATAVEEAKSKGHFQNEEEDEEVYCLKPDAREGQTISFAFGGSKRPAPPAATAASAPPARPPPAAVWGSDDDDGGGGSAAGPSGDWDDGRSVASKGAASLFSMGGGAGRKKPSAIDSLIAENQQKRLRSSLGLATAKRPR